MFLNALIFFRHLFTLAAFALMFGSCRRTRASGIRSDNSLD